MANFDIVTDPAPQNTVKPVSGPTITALRAALTAHNATSYSAARLDQYSENDMVYACKVHGLSVTGL
jgi:hypothetical protein